MPVSKGLLGALRLDICSCICLHVNREIGTLEVLAENGLQG